MSRFLLMILETDLYGSIAILVVLLFRFLFRKLPKRITIVFWLAVALRLLCPFNFSSPTSVLNLNDSGSITHSIRTVAGVENEQLLREEVQIPEQVSEVTPEKTSSVPVNKIVFAAWISVATLMILSSAVKYRRMNRFIKSCRKTPDGKYYESDYIDSPFVTGIFTSRICVPTAMDESERDYILCHEMMHIQNHDGLIKFVGYIVLSIHWFNPLVWLAFYLLCNDIEMRVDEKVTEIMDPETKKAYCLSIVNHAVVDPAGPALQNTAFSGMGFGGMEAKRRIKNLLTYRKISGVMAFGVLLVTILASVLASACGFEKDPVRTVLNEASVVIASEEKTTGYDYINEDGYNYKESPYLRQVVDMYIYEGLQISEVRRVYGSGQAFNHEVVMSDSEGNIRKIITDVQDLTGVMRKYKLESYEGKDLDDITDEITDWSKYNPHPNTTDEEGLHEYFPDQSLIVTSR